MKYFFTGLQMTLDIILSESNLEYSFQEYLVDKCSSKKEKKKVLWDVFEKQVRNLLYYVINIKLSAPLFFFFFNSNLNSVVFWFSLFLVLNML